MALMGAMMAEDLVLTGLAAVGSVALGFGYCLRLFRLISRVRLDGEKDDEGLTGRSRSLLKSHRTKQVENMREISEHIARGADAFLITQYRYLICFMAVSSLTVALVVSCRAAGAHLVGCGTSILAGYVGMKIATYSNSRTTYELWMRGQANKYEEASDCDVGDLEGYNVAMRGGWVASLSLTSFGVSSLFALAATFHFCAEGRGDAWQSLTGFSFGVASIGLFSRVGGGIFTKAADIGADLSASLDGGLAWNDHRNPACIADNVGDNVGGVVGFGADLLGSLVSANCAALALASGGGLRADPRGVPMATT